MSTHAHRASQNGIQINEGSSKLVTMVIFLFWPTSSREASPQDCVRLARRIGARKVTYTSNRVGRVESVIFGQRGWLILIKVLKAIVPFKHISKFVMSSVLTVLLESLNNATDTFLPLLVQNSQHVKDFIAPVVIVILLQPPLEFVWTN